MMHKLLQIRWMILLRARWSTVRRLTVLGGQQQQCYVLSDSQSTAGTQKWRVGDGGGASAVAERDALRLEIARLDNATVHLESSNTELRTALTEDPSDTDFREAIGVRGD
jgi:hypothetical protein